MSEYQRYECHACKKTLTSEHHFLNHKCSRLDRENEARTTDGQVAYMYYELWMSFQKRVPPSFDTFTRSHSFTYILNFVKFSKRVRLPQPTKFIKYCIRKGFHPAMWSTNLVYVNYLEMLDYIRPPIEQFDDSVKYLTKIANRAELSIGQLIDTLDLGDITELIRQRHISPWYVLFSKRIYDKTTNTKQTDQLLMFRTVVRPEFWTSEFAKYPIETATFKKAVTKLEQI